jgi:hypothetical protein
VFTSEPTPPGADITRVMYSYPTEPPVDPQQFQLTYYNLTPPAGEVYEDRPGFNWPLWGGIGLACIALSVVLAWLVRRKRRTT